MKFSQIPQIPFGNYRNTIFWGHLEKFMDELKKDYNADFDPDFQREHVWNEKQQISYVEWVLRGGQYGLDILCNCEGWHSGKLGAYVLVDGKQRLNAALRFLHNKIPIFGNNYFKDFDEPLRMSTTHFNWCVSGLNTRKEVLQFYIDLNAGGTVHADEEISKVKNLLKKEK